jgi:hypothetical protein
MFPFPYYLFYKDGVAPLIVAHFDKESVHAVIMQLEIEDDYSKSHETKEISVKEFLTLNNFAYSLDHPIELPIPRSLSFELDKHVQAFYPPVPTPPPNA